MMDDIDTFSFSEMLKQRRGSASRTSAQKNNSTSAGSNRRFSEGGTGGGSSSFLSAGDDLSSSSSKFFGGFPDKTGEGGATLDMRSSGGGGGGETAKKGMSTSMKSAAEMVGECCVPATVALLRRSLKKMSCEHSDRFHLHGRLVGAVVLTGWVMKAETFASQLTLHFSDGTGVASVHYDFEGQNSGDSYSSVGGIALANASSSSSSSPVSLFQPGRLVRVIGSVRPFDKAAPLACEVDACHLKPLEVSSAVASSDVEEFAFFSVIETVFAATRLSDSAKEEVQSSPSANHKKNEKRTTEGDNVKSKAELSALTETKDWENVELPRYQHITDPAQVSILKILHFRPEAKGHGISRARFFEALSAKHGGDRVDDALAELANEGEITCPSTDMFGLPL